jgi:hypothetical protein
MFGHGFKVCFFKRVSLHRYDEEDELYAPLFEFVNRVAARARSGAAYKLNSV